MHVSTCDLGEVLTTEEGQNYLNVELTTIILTALSNQTVSGREQRPEAWV